jgi:hypothetical protein
MVGLNPSDVLHTGYSGIDDPLSFIIAITSIVHYLSKVPFIRRIIRNNRTLS